MFIQDNKCVPAISCCLSAGVELTSEDHGETPDDTAAKRVITVKGDNNSINVGSSNQLNKPIAGRFIICGCTSILLLVMFYNTKPTDLDVRLRTLVFQILRFNVKIASFLTIFGNRYSNPFLHNR